MREKSFPIGSIIRGGESIYLKTGNKTWTAFDLAEEIEANEVQEFFDGTNPYAEKIEVLYKPDHAVVLEELPPGSVVLGGDSEVAIKFEEEWSVSGSEAWYVSAAVLEMLGNEFEVLRRGETD